MILSFTSRFVPMVLDGSKRQTIRAGSRWRAGMRADLYTGSYRKGERRLLFRAIVTCVEPIDMFCTEEGWKVRISGNILTDAEREQLFVRDGFWPNEDAEFDSSASYAAYLYFGPFFTGQVIRWDYERRFQAAEDTCFHLSAWKARSTA